MQRSGLALTDTAPPGFPGQGSLGEALLQPTQIYAAQLQQLRQEANIKVGYSGWCACRCRMLQMQGQGTDQSASGS